MLRIGKFRAPWKRVAQFALVYAAIGFAFGLLELFTEQGLLVPDWHKFGDWVLVMGKDIPAWPIVVGVGAAFGNLPSIAFIGLSVWLFVRWLRAVKEETAQTGI